MVLVSPSGIVQPLQTSAFGELSVAQLTPRIQLQFPYTINSDSINISVTGSGTVTHSSPFAVCSTTAAINSSAQISSKNSLHYRTGQGGVCMFTAVFTQGVANSVQEVGLGDTTDGFFFGYNGNTFSINRRYNGSNNYIPQSSWNQDKMDGTGPSGMTLIPTNGNVYKIQYQWLGFGGINFFIENSETNAFVLVHTINYANTSTLTSVLNPSLPVFVRAANTSNNTNIVVKVPSIAAFVEGNILDTGLINSINNAKSNVTTQLNILTIRNNATFNSFSNKKFVEPLVISLGNTSNADCTFRLILNTTLGGSPSYTNISTATSVVAYDTAGTTITGGQTIATVYILGNRSDIFYLDNIPFILNASDTLTVSATSSGAALTASVAITWSEQF